MHRRGELPQGRYPRNIRISNRSPLANASPTWDANIPSSRVLGRPANILSLKRFLKRLTFIAERLNQDYFLGAGFSVADAYLFVMLMWSRKNGLSLPVPLPAWFERMKARPAVQRSLKEEGLL